MFGDRPLSERFAFFIVGSAVDELLSDMTDCCRRAGKLVRRVQRDTPARAGVCSGAGAVKRHRCRAGQSVSVSGVVGRIVKRPDFKTDGVREACIARRPVDGPVARR